LSKQDAKLGQYQNALDEQLVIVEEDIESSISNQSDRDRLKKLLESD